MATTTTSAPATAVQVERIAELYDSRVVPEEKKRDPATMSERSAKRWITLLEAYPLKEETVQGVGGRNAQPAKARTQRAKAQPKPATNGGTTDKKRQAQAAKAPKAKAERAPVDGKLAQRAVTMRAKLDDRGRPTSWAKIGYALKLVPEGAPKAQAGDAARRAYRQIKGADAPTGPSDY
jgi:hypothetical protein